MAEAAGARARRAPRDGARPPRRAVERVGGGVGRGGRRCTAAARGAAATVARSEPRRGRRRTSTASASGSSRTRSCPPTSSRATARSPRPRSGRGRRCSRTATSRSPTCSSTATRSPASIDWSEASRGDALYDLASLTLGHEEHLDDVIAGYGTDVDVDVIRAWWSLRSLLRGPLAGRARLRPVVAGLRVRRAAIPDVNAWCGPLTRRASRSSCSMGRTVCPEPGGYRVGRRPTWYRGDGPRGWHRSRTP